MAKPLKVHKGRSSYFLFLYRKRRKKALPEGRWPYLSWKRFERWRKHIFLVTKGLKEKRRTIFMLHIYLREKKGRVYRLRREDRVHSGP